MYELQKLRCGLCGETFIATAPNDIDPEKYDAKAVSMMALLKYGTGLPFNRLQRLQEDLGIPLAASTQWETVSEQEGVFGPVYQAFIVAAAQGKILHNDDTISICQSYRLYQFYGLNNYGVNYHANTFL